MIDYVFHVCSEQTSHHCCLACEEVTNIPSCSSNRVNQHWIADSLFFAWSFVSEGCRQSVWETHRLTFDLQSESSCSLRHFLQDEFSVFVVFLLPRRLRGSVNVCVCVGLLHYSLIVLFELNKLTRKEPFEPLDQAETSLWTVPWVTDPPDIHLW